MVTREQLIAECNFNDGCDLPHEEGRHFKTATGEPVWLL